MTVNRLIPLTDDRGKPLLHPDDMKEPNPGSVVLVSGVFGTAWQRRFLGGRWHKVGGTTSRDWDELCRTYRNMVLVYDAPERD